jgi:hypothetical protein
VLYRPPPWNHVQERIHLGPVSRTVTIRHELRSMEADGYIAVRTVAWPHWPVPLGAKMSTRMSRTNTENKRLGSMEAERQPHDPYHSLIDIGKRPLGPRFSTTFPSQNIELSLLRHRYGTKRFHGIIAMTSLYRYRTFNCSRP